MRALVMWMLLALAATVPSFAENVSVSGAPTDQQRMANRGGPVTYYILDLGYARFEPGTTFEQALARLCANPKTPEKYKNEHCAAPTPAAKSASETSNLGAIIQPGSHSDEPAEDRAKALGSSVFGAILAFALAAGFFRITVGSSAASSGRKGAAFGASLAVWLAFMPLMSDLVMVGSPTDTAIYKLVGFTLWAPILAGFGYLIRRQKDGLSKTELAHSPSGNASASLEGSLISADKSPLARDADYSVRNADLATKTADNKSSAKLANGGASMDPNQISATDPYEIAGQELLDGKMDPALWARALVKGEGDDGPTRAEYVRSRVEKLNQEARLRDDADREAAENEREANEAFATRYDVSAQDAAIMRPLGITLIDGRYVVRDVDGAQYRYDTFSDAEAYARKVVQ